MQLNHVGLKIWEQKPIAGSGLNNFEQVMDRYDTYGLIFDAPAHNLYILQLAESGILGLIGLFVLAVPLFLVAVRLARSRDRLLSAVGFGVTGAFVFWGAEEMLEFSLRQEQPPRVVLHLRRPGGGMLSARGSRSAPARAAHSQPATAATDQRRSTGGRPHRERQRQRRSDRGRAADPARACSRVRTSGARSRPPAAVRACGTRSRARNGRGPSGSPGAAGAGGAPCRRRSPESCSRAAVSASRQAARSRPVRRSTA